MAAESVGLAASIGGIVSLGLTITGGIIKYVDAFENRQEELDFVSRQNKVLEAVLLAFDTHLRSHGQSGAVPDAVAQSMQLFEKELNHVKALHSDLADIHSQSLATRLRNRKKKVTYAFDRSKLQELGLRLQKGGHALQLTLNLLGLQVSRQNTETLAAVESSTQGISSELSTIRSELAAFETPTAKFEDQLCLLRRDIDSNTQLFVSQYDAVSVEVQGSRNDLRNVQETTDAVHHLAQLQQRRDQEMTRQYEEMNNNIGQILEHLQHSDVQISTREAVLRGLAGKPALLKRLSDEFQSSVQTHVQLGKPRLQKISASPIHNYPYKSIMGRVCTCPRLQSAIKSKSIQLGHASFCREWERIAHWPGCPMARLNSKQRMTIAFKYSGLVSMLKTAVNISFVMTSGAGGFSISPSFTCSPTVDVDFDPAFRVVSLVGEGLWHLGSNGPHAESFMMTCMTRMSRLFDDRKVCATAVDSQNMSLMHYTILSLDYLLPTCFGEKDCRIIRSLFVEFVQMLLSYGVAAFTFDLKGMSPLVSLSASNFEYDISQAVTEVLIQANSNEQPLIVDTSYIKFAYQPGPTWIPIMSVKSLYEVYSDFAKVSECGPLSMAVIQDDANGVEYLLNRTPRSTAEIDVFGQTPFHLAAAKPAILEILLDHGDCSSLDRRDLSGFTALEIAMIQTSGYCENGQDTARCDGNKCGCCRCVDLLLDAECNARMHKLTKGDHAPELHHFLKRASELARQKYVYYMKTRRDSAMQTPHASRHAWTKSENWESSKESEITQVKFTTAMTQKHDGSFLSDAAGDMSWVFLEIDDPHLGALFYRHGFQPHASSLNHLRSMNIAYLDFLVSQGVDPFSRSSRGPAPIMDYPNVGLFGAHFAFYSVSLSFRQWIYDDTGSRDAFLETFARVCGQNLTDGCECHCTIDGCTPFTWMLKGTFQKFLLHRPRGRNVRLFDRHVEDLVCHYSRCGLKLTSVTYKAAIRYTTFGALGLAHTCCNARDLVQYDGEWVERDDVDILNEEQAALLKVFEALVNEFEEKALEFMKLDLSGNSSFPQFWVDCWKMRMEEELQKLEGEDLTDTERNGAEEIGVRWNVSQEETEKENPYKVWDLEHWLFELDRICPEYVEPWPKELHRVAGLP